MNYVTYSEVIKVVNDGGFDYELTLPTEKAKDFVTEYINVKESMNLSDLSIYDENLGTFTPTDSDFDNPELGPTLTLIGTASVFINLDWWDNNVKDIYVTEVGSETLWMEYLEEDKGE